MLSRDCDSRLNKREKLAVDEWLKSDKSFHIMRDHPWHDTEILGGMWGVRGDILSNMKDLIDNYVKGDFYKVDENFLKEHIYNEVKNDCFVHDEFFNYDAIKKCFPEKRNGQEFVGEVLDEFDKPNIQHRNVIIVHNSFKEKLKRILIKLISFINDHFPSNTIFKITFKNCFTYISSFLKSLKLNHEKKNRN